MIDGMGAVAAVLPTTGQTKPKSADVAAKQFESLLIGEMLRSARESMADDDGDSDTTKQTMLDVADQQFAQVLSNNGGLGIAQMIVHGLKRESK